MRCANIPVLKALLDHHDFFIIVVFSLLYAGLPCEIGLRTRTYHVLIGSVLSVWNKVETVLATTSGASNQRMQIIRLRTDAGTKIVG